MSEFHKTPLGTRYYQVTLPALIESNNRLAKAQEKANDLQSKKIDLLEEQIKIDKRRLLFESKEHGLNESKEGKSSKR